MGKRTQKSPHFHKERGNRRLYGKRGRSCSVENLPAPEDHEIEGDRSQNGFAALAPISSGSQGGAQQPLQHTVDGFHLPALRVSSEVQSLCHLSSPVSTGRFVSASPDQRRDQGTHSAVAACILVRVLGVVAGIQSYGVDSDSSQALVQQRPEMLDVGAGPRAGTTARIK